MEVTPLYAILIILISAPQIFRILLLLCNNSSRFNAVKVTAVRKRIHLPFIRLKATARERAADSERNDMPARKKISHADLRYWLQSKLNIGVSYELLGYPTVCHRFYGDVAEEGRGGLRRAGVTGVTGCYIHKKGRRPMEI
jgi:hypothetical protein